MERNCKWKWQLVELSEYLCFCAGFIAIEIEDEIDCTGSKSAEDMDIEVDHYAVLGLPSGEEGFKLSEKEISKAYRLKALELHPDKRPDDPNADANFQKLKTSYDPQG
ncbi:unnamed protein product [Ilex paraguariensis]|uniref:J domain-containing protein n=1 Tax=Ilex paraguariensis TaxID=185542 RepID=A0ABC8UY42_9AQUA